MALEQYSAIEIIQANTVRIVFEFDSDISEFSRMEFAVYTEDGRTEINEMSLDAENRTGTVNLSAEDTKNLRGQCNYDVKAFKSSGEARTLCAPSVFRVVGVINKNVR